MIVDFWAPAARTCLSYSGRSPADWSLIGRSRWNARVVHPKSWPPPATTSPPNYHDTPPWPHRGLVSAIHYFYDSLKLQSDVVSFINFIFASPPPTTNSLFVSRDISCSVSRNAPHRYCSSFARCLPSLYTFDLRLRVSIDLRGGVASLTVTTLTTKHGCVYIF